jgi:hypothetical protein
MQTLTLPHPATAARPLLDANAILSGAGRFWGVTAILGQWAFVYYIVGFYVVSTLQGDFQAWGLNERLFKGYVPGDRAGNLAFAAHVLLAAIVAFGGTVQLIPQIRKRFIAVHRWNGRLFLLTAIAASLAGVYLAWGRSGPAVPGASGNAMGAILIVVFGVLAWRAARAGDVTSHRRWALRAFLAVNGVWFQRVGMMAWVIVNQGPTGIRQFFDVWQFGSYLLPLAMLELYLRAQASGSPARKFAAAGALIVLTLLMGAGIVGMYVFSWGPLLGKV